MELVTVATDSGDQPGAPVGSGLSASQRRAELRRRKLLMNSEQRINRIMGFHRPGSGAGEDLRFPSMSPPPIFRIILSSAPLIFLTKSCSLTPQTHLSPLLRLCPKFSLNPWTFLVALFNFPEASPRGCPTSASGCAHLASESLCLPALCPVY